MEKQKNRKAPLLHKEAWKERVAMKENIALGMSILSLIITLIVILIS